MLHDERGKIKAFCIVLIVLLVLFMLISGAFANHVSSGLMKNGLDDLEATKYSAQP